MPTSSVLLLLLLAVVHPLHGRELSSARALQQAIPPLKLVKAGGMKIKVPKTWVPSTYEADPRTVVVFTAPELAGCGQCNDAAIISDVKIPLGLAGLSGMSNFPLPPGLATPYFWYAFIAAPDTVNVFNSAYNTDDFQSALFPSAPAPAAYFEDGVEYWTGTLLSSSVKAGVSYVTSFNTALVDGTIYSMAAQWSEATWAANAALAAMVVRSFEVELEP